MNDEDFHFEPCTECGLRSYVWVSLQSGKTLPYCGHHYSVHAEALAAQKAYILDKRHRIA